MSIRAQQMAKQPRGQELRFKRRAVRGCWGCVGLFCSLVIL